MLQMLALKRMMKTIIAPNMDMVSILTHMLTIMVIMTRKMMTIMTMAIMAMALMTTIISMETSMMMEMGDVTVVSVIPKRELYTHSAKMSDYQIRRKIV